MHVKVGLIRVLTEESNEFCVHKDMLESRFPALRVISRCINDQPEGIFDEETEGMAVPKVLALGKNMENEGAGAIIVDCASDPGVRELRAILKIPVIGAGSSSASLALAYGSRIGVLGIRHDAPAIMKEILGNRLAAAAHAEGVRTALDLLTDDGWKNSVRAAEYMGRKKIDVIALACTGYSTPGTAEKLEKAAGVPVIDALIAAGLFARHFTAERRR